MRFQPAEWVHSRAFDGELVILDMERGEYFALDAIGAELWQALCDGKTVDDIADSIAKQYDVEREKALADLVALRDELIAKRLLVLK